MTDGQFKDWRIRGLFLLRMWGPDIFQRSLNLTVIPVVTKHERLEICTRISDSQAPYLGGIPNKDFRFAAKSRSEMFVVERNVRFDISEGIFPLAAAEAVSCCLSLVKFKASHPPMCLLNTVRKMLE